MNRRGRVRAGRMSVDDDRVRDHFATVSLDLTPTAARATTRVLYAPVSGDRTFSKRCASVLSGDEGLRGGRFVAESDQVRFTQRRAFRRFCGAIAFGASMPLSEIVFTETENGRPWFPGSPACWFSFSSCRSGMLGAWSWTHAVGVDLEDPSKDLEVEDLAREFFSAAEITAVERARGLARLQVFYRLWTLKESALKSIGEGLPYGLDTFEFELTPELRVVHAPADHGGPATFSPHVLPGTDVTAALVTRTLAPGNDTIR